MSNHSGSAEGAQVRYRTSAVSSDNEVAERQGAHTAQQQAGGLRRVGLVSWTGVPSPSCHNTVLESWVVPAGSQQKMDTKEGRGGESRGILTGVLAEIYYDCPRS